MLKPTTDDILGVLDVVALYGYVVDERAWHRLGEVFTESAVLDAQYRVASGWDAIAEYLESFDAARTHLVTNTIVRVDRDGLRALSKFLVASPHEPEVSGEYVDRFTRSEGGRLLITHRQINLRNRSDRAPNGRAWRVESLDRW